MFRVVQTQQSIQEAIEHRAFNMEQGSLQIPTDTTGINVSHHIHNINFGPSFPGMANSLNGALTCAWLVRLL